MTIDERRQRLREWLKIIRLELQGIIVDNHVFWEVQAMFRTNRKLAETPSLFNEWMASNFVQAAAVGIRRLSEKGENVVSACRFIEEIAKFPELVSRSSVVKRYREASQSVPDEMCRDLANHDYDRYVGSGLELPVSEDLQREIEEIGSATQSIKHYVDRRTAHYDRRGLTFPVPKFEDLERCLQLLEDFVKKYEILLNGAGYSELMPTFQYDWKAIFRIPWAPSKHDTTVGV